MSIAEFIGGLMIFILFAGLFVLICIMSGWKAGLFVFGGTFILIVWVCLAVFLLDK